MLDCQWLQQLTSYRLLRGAFRPADAVCVLRALSRQREMLLLTEMNIQLTNVIVDIVGETGPSRRIVSPDRHPPVQQTNQISNQIVEARRK